MHTCVEERRRRHAAATQAAAELTLLRPHALQDDCTRLTLNPHALQDDCTRFQQFPPGHYYNSKTEEFTRYYNPRFYTDFDAKPERFPSTPLDLVLLRTSFEKAVVKRLMSDVPFGEGGPQVMSFLSSVRQSWQSSALDHHRLLLLLAPPYRRLALGWAGLLPCGGGCVAASRGHPRNLGPPALVLHRPQWLPGPGGSTQGGRLPQHRPSRVHLHSAGEA